ncbi:hypothetical protein PVNG_02411 [Plasmodium vivax North Korean]|uniref:Uncharacterized protein n=1 Tax=Plasmodium vivax North Korean TaxID=1035514 RepID=A0A0J9W6R0_PLAVI|nr:hypothetical protein PVNG_02411 [Plasmodium vivax North Korean]
MIIVGLGITPDLMYPMQSWLTYQPDKNREGLVFVDKFGFNDLKERGSIKYQEQYITIGLPEVIKEKGKDAEKEYMKKLQLFLDTKFGKYKDFLLLTKLGEQKGSDQLYGLRNSYIPTFQSRVSAASYTLSAVVYSIVLVLLLVLIKKYLNSNIYLFGNFVANGMMKIDVLLNVCIFTLIPLAVATAIGYLLSLILLPSLYSIISSYWFLEVKMSTLGAEQSGEYNLVTYSDLGKAFNKETSDIRKDSNHIFGVTPAGVTDSYSMGRRREPEILKEIFKEYKGQVDGWWSDPSHCNSSGKLEEDGKVIEGNHACMGSLGVFEKKDSENS